MWRRYSVGVSVKFSKGNGNSLKKLQQFYIMKFSSDRLEEYGYHLKRVIGGSGANDVRNNQELIALGDNQALRTIRAIRYERNPKLIQYDPVKLQDLYLQKRALKKQVFTNKVKKQISIINTQIDDMLFMPEYVSVVIEDIKHYYTIIEKGLYINGFRYVRLMCSAGQARVNTVILIREDFEEETKRRLKCGAKEIKITKNKYNAYFALSSSSTYLIPKPNVLLVGDCEIEMTKHVDWISKIPPEEKTKLSNNERVSEEDKTLSFNLFDGCGAISVEFAKRIAEELDLDYIPSAYCIRCAYVKGMVFVVDFKEYARENDITVVPDMYGNPQRVEDIDIILTKSQFKLYNAYDSIEDYNRLCEENGILWGVTKATPKKDNNYFRSNYQFCQALSLTDDEDIAELCQPTVDWLSGIVGQDVNYSLLYLLGNICDNPDNDFSQILRLTDDKVAKALLLNHDMIREEYIRSTVVQSINKKIRETYLGKLILEGNFSVMIPDMYAFMQHAFGQKVTGALQENEYYSHFWNERNVDTVVGMRSPLTWRSEVNKLSLVQNKITEKWFKYLTSGIVYNVWGCDCIIHADSDWDGDLVASTNNKIFLKCRYDNLPITYEKSTVEKEYIKEEELYQADIMSFNSTIGQITNISTTFYEILSKFEGKPEYAAEEAEIIERLKLIRKSQGDAIDKAKGIKVEKMPPHWTHRVTSLPKGETQERMDFCNSIVADRKPYFFRYLYSRENNKYLEHTRQYNKRANKNFSKSLDAILNTDYNLLSPEEQNLIDNYYEYSPLVDCNGRMNRICHHMETELKEIKQSVYHTPEEILNLMRNDPTREFSQKEIDLMNGFYLDYKREKGKIKKKELTGYFEEDGHTFDSITVYCKWARKEIVNSINKDMDYIVDLAIYVCYTLYPSRTKCFVWDTFGNNVLENIKKHSDSIITVPVKSNDGDIHYLGGNYKLLEVDLTNESEI